MEFNFETIAKILTLIANTSDTTTKKELLRRFNGVPGFREVLGFIFNPYVKTGIKKAKLDKAMCDIAFAPALGVKELMKYFETNSTGSGYDCAVAASFVDYWYGENEQCGAIAEALVTKNLQIGVKATTLNDVYGKGFIPVIGIMRGMVAPAVFNGTYIATEKIDGNRRLLVNDENGVKIYTRSGIRDIGLVEIEEQLANLPAGYVYDTEGTKIGIFKNSLDCRQASASVFNSDGIRKGVKVQIFDMIPIDEYNAGESVLPAILRKLMLSIIFNDTAGVNILNSLIVDLPAYWHHKWSHMWTAIINAGLRIKDTPNIEVLPILGIVHNMKEALELTQPLWDKGLEGTMLNEIEGKYEVRTSPRKHLLKIKATVEGTVKVVDVYEGKNSYEGMLGGVNVVFTAADKKQYNFNLGGGFSHYERELYWNSPELIIGKTIEVDSFGETTNASGGRALNCARFKRIKGGI